MDYNYIECFIYSDLWLIWEQHLEVAHLHAACWYGIMTGWITQFVDQLSFDYWEAAGSKCLSLRDFVACLKSSLRSLWNTAAIDWYAQSVRDHYRWQDGNNVGHLQLIKSHLYSCWSFACLQWILCFASCRISSSICYALRICWPCLILYSWLLLLMILRHCVALHLKNLIQDIVFAYLSCLVASAFSDLRCLLVSKRQDFHQFSIFSSMSAPLASWLLDSTGLNFLGLSLNSVRSAVPKWFHFGLLPLPHLWSSWLHSSSFEKPFSFGRLLHWRHPSLWAKLHLSCSFSVSPSWIDSALSTNVDYR